MRSHAEHDLARACHLDAQPIEEVHLLRDEGANLAWAVEATARRSDGFPVDRAGAWRAEQGRKPPVPAGGDPAWRYRLRTTVPSTGSRSCR